MTDLDPAFLAKVDQQRAQTADNVTAMVAFFRQQVVDHDGDTLCAWGHLAHVVFGDVHGNPVLLTDLLCGCVERISNLERELGR